MNKQPLEELKADDIDDILEELRIWELEQSRFAEY